MGYMGIRISLQKSSNFPYRCALTGVFSGGRLASRTNIHQPVFNFKVYYAICIALENLNHTTLVHIIFVTEEKVFIHSL